MKRLIALGLFGGFLFFSLTIWAQVPELLNYQGRLTDDVGTPITATITVRFSLYQGGDAATPGSGTLCYQEDASVTPDDNGVFNHLIGSGTVIFGALDSTVFQTADPVYLEITIDPAGANETLLPRKQIVTVGYSFKSELADDADTVDGQDASAFAPVVHNHDPDYVNEGQADSVTSAMIVNGTIVDTDINAGANIAGTKIDPTGLDADLLDGKDSLDFVHTTGDDMTGTLSVITTGAAYSIYGNDENTTGITYGLFGESSSTDGRGIFGLATATSGVTYGVYGQSDSSSDFASGVYGLATATSSRTYGVYGTTSSTSAYASGVYGKATATSGTNYGVFGQSYSTKGGGVYGAAPLYGVYAFAFATSGTNYGVYGSSASPSGYGVYGTAPANGVYGEATAEIGSNWGVYGRTNSASGIAVYGVAAAAYGETYGVFGRCSSTGGYGVYGQAISSDGFTFGVYGESNSLLGFGIYGVNSVGGYAGYFNAKVHVAGDLTVGGSKPCVQPIDNGKKVLLYAMESPEIWFEDFGTAQLVNGQAVVPIENVFAQTANIEMGYLIFLTPIGECNGLYISSKDKDSFEVRELGGGTSNISFDYRIVAKRRGYEEVRFEEFTEPEQPPAEPNLPVEKK